MAFTALPTARNEVRETLVVIAGFNGLATANAWARKVTRHSPDCCAIVYSWRHAKHAAKFLSRSSGVTLIGHSLGGGFAQLLAEKMPPGTIHTLITVAPFAPRAIDTVKVRDNVGWWLNIVSASHWQDHILNLAGRCLLGWRDQGVISAASENCASRFPHKDFYKMISDCCGAAEHGKYRSPRGGNDLFSG